MINGKLENNFISGQDKETLRRTRTERQNYEEIANEFRKRITSDLSTDEIKKASLDGAVSLSSIQTVLKVQGSYLRSIDTSLKKLIKDKNNYFKQILKALGPSISSNRLNAVYDNNKRQSIINNNNDIKKLNDGIKSFTDVIRELNEQQKAHNTEVMAVLSEVPTDIHTRLKLSINEMLRSHPMLRKIYAFLDKTLFSFGRWGSSLFKELIGFDPEGIFHSFNVFSLKHTGRWNREIKIEKGLPIQSILSILSAIHKNTWLLNNKTLPEMMEGKKRQRNQIYDDGLLKRVMDNVNPLTKAIIRAGALSIATLPAASKMGLINALGLGGGSLMYNIINPLSTILLGTAKSILMGLGGFIISNPFAATSIGVGTAALYSIAKRIAMKRVQERKEIEKARQKASGALVYDEKQGYDIHGKKMSENERSSGYFKYIAQELFRSDFLEKGYINGMKDIAMSIFNQKALRKEREEQEEEHKKTVAEKFKTNFLLEINKKGRIVLDAIIGLKELEYDVSMMRKAIAGDSAFKDIQALEEEKALMEFESKKPRSFWQAVKNFLKDERSVAHVLSGNTNGLLFNGSINSVKNHLFLQNAFYHKKETPYLYLIMNSIDTIRDRLFGIKYTKETAKEFNDAKRNELQQNLSNAIKNGTSDDIQKAFLAREGYIDVVKEGDIKQPGLLYDIKRNSSNNLNRYLTYEAVDPKDPTKKVIHSHIYDISKALRDKNNDSWLLKIHNILKKLFDQLLGFDKAMLPGMAIKTHHFGYLERFFKKEANQNDVNLYNKLNLKPILVGDVIPGPIYEIKTLLENIRDAINGTTGSAVRGYGIGIYERIARIEEYFVGHRSVKDPHHFITGIRYSKNGSYYLDTDDLSLDYTTGSLENAKYSGFKNDFQSFASNGNNLTPANQTLKMAAASGALIVDFEPGNYFSLALNRINSLLEKILKYGYNHDSTLKPKFATGGIVTRQTNAIIGEGNKAEAIIPLENARYMLPFSMAVASQLSGLMSNKEAFIESIQLGTNNVIDVLRARSQKMKDMFMPNGSPDLIDSSKNVYYNVKDFLGTSLPKLGELIENPENILGSALPKWMSILIPALGVGATYLMTSPTVKERLRKFVGSLFSIDEWKNKYKQGGLLGMLGLTLGDWTDTFSTFGEIAEGKGSTFHDWYRWLPNLIEGVRSGSFVANLGQKFPVISRLAQVFKTGEFKASWLGKFGTGVSKFLSKVPFLGSITKFIGKFNIIGDWWAKFEDAAKTVKDFASGLGSAFGGDFSFDNFGERILEGISGLGKAASGIIGATFLGPGGYSIGSKAFELGSEGINSVLGDGAKGIFNIFMGEWDDGIKNIFSSLTNIGDTIMKPFTLLPNQISEWLTGKKATDWIKEFFNDAYDRSTSWIHNKLVGTWLGEKLGITEKKLSKAEILKENGLSMSGLSHLDSAQKERVFELIDDLKDNDYNAYQKYQKSYELAQLTNNINLLYRANSDKNATFFSSDQVESFKKTYDKDPNELAKKFCDDNSINPYQFMMLPLDLRTRFMNQVASAGDNGLGDTVIDHIIDAVDKVQAENELKRDKLMSAIDLHNSTTLKEKAVNAAKVAQYTVQDTLSSAADGASNFIKNSSIKVTSWSKNAVGNALAKENVGVAMSMGGSKSLHKCATGVKQAMANIGLLPYKKMDAWQMGDYLASSGKFKEITGNFPTKASLINTPRGSVIVWNKKAGSSKYGHVATSLGNGREASDHIRPLIMDNSNRYGGYRVFYPNAGALGNATVGMNMLSNAIKNSEIYKSASSGLSDAGNWVSEKYNNVKNAVSEYDIDGKFDSLTNTARGYISDTYNRFTNNETPQEVQHEETITVAQEGVGLLSSIKNSLSNSSIMTLLKDMSEYMKKQNELIKELSEKNNNIVIDNHTSTVSSISSNNVSNISSLNNIDGGFGNGFGDIAGGTSSLDYAINR